MKAACRMLPGIAPIDSALIARTWSQLVALLFLLVVLPTLTHPALSQNAAPNNPLSFGNNFFVTGDYVVAGAYNMAKTFTTINGVSYAVGTINVPDTNPGITGTKQLPPGAQVVAALLYWQTVETTSTLGSGANGYFRPLLYAGKGGPAAPGYSIQGTGLANEKTNPVPTGCSGTLSGNNKVIQTYRADVSGGLPVDSNGNPLANGSFEIRLPSTNNGQPFALGATLVLIYSVPGGLPNVPLNSIVIYDGDFAQNNAHPTMIQSMQGFYDADTNTISRLTHIVASGASNKFETVYLGSTNPPNSPNPLVKLPSLYGSQLPSFPGWYGNWDNPTWTFQGKTNPVLTDSSIATTQVVPAAMNQACPSWGAIIVSTTVKNSDNDGILDSWKKNRGYCDVGTALAPNAAVCNGPGDPAWVDLPNPHIPGQGQDVYLQYDYMCSKITGGKCDVPTLTVNSSLTQVVPGSGQTTYLGTFSTAVSPTSVVKISGFSNFANNGQFTVRSSNGSQIVVNNPGGVAETNPGVATYGDPTDQNYSFDPTLAKDSFDGQNAVEKVVTSFGDPTYHKPVVLHAVPGNAIAESQATCGDADTQNGSLSCPFPNEPGTVGFREGLDYIKNQTIEPSTGVLGCDPSLDTTCIPVFHHGKKDSYHYALFSHGVGLPSLFFADGSLASVKQTNNTVTFTTKAPHGIGPITTANGATKNDGQCPSGRVTVVFAASNPNLNGTFCAQNVTSNTFQITVGGSATTATYTAQTDPNLGVANGQVTSMSGYSDVGGQNSVISLGYGNWGPPNNPFADGNKWQVKGGTFMHELGHTLGLTHGGTFYNKYNPSANPPVLDYTASFEANCKPNVQTIMSYVFQFDLLQTGSHNPDGSPVKVVDYSEDPSAPGLIPTLAEVTNAGPNILDGLTYTNTSWFQPVAGPPPTSHCDGSPTAAKEQAYSYTNQPKSAFFLAAQQDINFDGNANETMDPHNEWEGTPAANGVGPSPGIDLRQVSALGTISTVGLGGEPGGKTAFGGGGGKTPLGGGGGLTAFGGGGGKTAFGGGGGKTAFGGGGASAEITHDQAAADPRPADGLFIVQEEASPRLIDLGWFGSTLSPDHYNIYQSTDGGQTFPKKVGTVPGSQTAFQVTVSCNNTVTPNVPPGYFYQVKAATLNALNQEVESAATNTVPAPGEPALTGCYTAPVAVTVQGTGVQGDIVPVKWTLTDDFYATPPAPWSSATAGNAVTNLAASTLVALGPDPTQSCAPGGRTTLLSKGQPQTINGTIAGSYSNSTGPFTFTLDTDVLCAGSYNFELDLDSGQSSTSSALQLSIDVGDNEPRIITPTLTAATVGAQYSQTVTEDGGVGTVTWTVGGLPSGITQQNSTGSTVTVSGTTCVAGSYTVTASVSDSAKPNANTGSQQYSLQVNKANTTTTVVSNANPSVFQQPVTFTVTVTPQGTCGPPTGTVTLYDNGTPILVPASLTNGTATFTSPVTSPTLFDLSVGVHSITAIYSGDANFKTSNGALSRSQTVNPAQTQTVLGPASPSTVFVGQPVTISFGFSVLSPGSDSPIPPAGNISVTASDGSSCVVAASVALVNGGCVLSPAPKAAGNVTYAVNYPALNAPADPDFVGSGVNGNYNVYQLVFTTQPSNTGVGNTITPAVVVTAEDSSNATLTSFTGPITLAIGSGHGKLSGTLAPNAVAGVATFSNLSINQIANNYTLTASPDGLSVSATSNTFDIETFYVDNQGNFGILDLPTGTVTQISKTATVPGATGIDLTAGLQVYTYNTSNQLVQINPPDGTPTPIGSVGTTSLTATGALTGGTYFGMDSAGNLHSIDLSSGAESQPVATSAGQVPAGCSFQASLTGSSSVLYYTLGYSGSTCTTQVPDLPDTLYEINSADGSVAAGPFLISGTTANFVGSTFVAGVLYGFTADGKEYSIDPTSGTATFHANTSTNAKPPVPVTIVGAGSQ
jgi:hypothetical protein